MQTATALLPATAPPTTETVAVKRDVHGRSSEPSIPEFGARQHWAETTDTLAPLFTPVQKHLAAKVFESLGFVGHFRRGESFSPRIDLNSA